MKIKLTKTVIIEADENIPLRVYNSEKESIINNNKGEIDIKYINDDLKENNENPRNN